MAHEACLQLYVYTIAFPMTSSRHAHRCCSHAHSTRGSLLCFLLSGLYICHRLLYGGLHTGEMLSPDCRATGGDPGGIPYQSGEEDRAPASPIIMKVLP